jgi:SEC-C motif-containing protein
MRSRYAAYSVGAVTHIMGTTHPTSPHFDPDTKRWTEQIRAFCQAMDFAALTVHSSEQTGSEGQVHFTAGLLDGEDDHSFSERSVFHRVNGLWLYHSGIEL